MLVFDHPVAGTQLPKGTVERDEGLADAAVRELAEESGITDAAVISKLGEWTRVTGAGPVEDGLPQQHVWHVMLLERGSPLPERWQHRASGSAAEEALVFSFRWLPLGDGLAEELPPVFSACSALLADGVG